MTSFHIWKTPWESARELQTELAKYGYLADHGLATAIHLTVSMRRPLFLEGEPGVGKTDVANMLAKVLEARVVRLQCYEGIDISQALYDWNHAKQILAIRTTETSGSLPDVDDLFSEDFLVERSILSAIRSTGPLVLLIDEVDRADDEFEAFLLEVLGDYSVTIPEIGTIRAEVPPVVILTSNRTRDIHDALKRRCFYHLIPHPDIEREAQILSVRVPEATESLALEVANAIAELRSLNLLKPPGIAESIDWLVALVFLGADRLELEPAIASLGSVIKQEEDLVVARDAMPRILRSHG